MDTHGKLPGLYNIETTKVLTYTSQEGEAAFEVFEAAIDTGTQSPIPWMFLGALLEDTGRYEEALPAYQEALTRDINNITLAQEMYDSLSAKFEAASS